MNKIIAAILLIGLVCTAQARLPVQGDFVRVTEGTISYDGNVTDIGQGLICLNCTMITRGDQYLDMEYPFETCLGIGSDTVLIWPSD